MPHFENLKLKELRSLALQDLKIPVEAIRAHGDLRLRATWLSAIASHYAQKTEKPATETANTAPTFQQDNWRDKERQVTSGQIDQKLQICYQINDEVKFVDGQMVIAIPLAQARSVARFAESGRWAEAFEVVQGNQRASRILARIREVVA